MTRLYSLKFSEDLLANRVNNHFSDFGSRMLLLTGYQISIFYCKWFKCICLLEFCTKFLSFIFNSERHHLLANSFISKVLLLICETRYFLALNYRLSTLIF